MKIIVIGSNSFSGAHFVNHLLKKKNNVLGVSRSKVEKIFLPYKHNKNIKNFKFKKLDLNKNLNKLKKVILEFRPNYIVNFASQGMVAESWNSPEDWFNTNTTNTIDLLNFLKDQKYLKKYIHVSTPEVYGSTTKNIRENYIFRPTTPYAISRAATDMTLKAFYDAYKFPYIITRAANVYGPCQQLYRIIPITILNILSKKKIFLHGGGKSKRSFIHINDVVKATYLLMKNSKVGQTYHISTKNLISINSLVKKICLKLNVRFSDVVINTKDRLGKDNVYDLSSNKIKRTYKWKPQIKLDEGIDEMIEWVNKNFKKLKKYPWHYIHKK